MNLLFATILATLAMGGVEERPKVMLRDTMSDTWAATDALERSLPGNKECGSPRADKVVGVFYFLWQHKQHDTGLFDNTKLIATNPENPKYGPKHAFHWWGEPFMGYYYMDDAFVIRKHAQMLTDAGVDVIFFDVTNALTYDENLLAVCKVFTEIRKTGRTTPQIAFLANSNHVPTVQHLYDTFYAKGLYSDLWFRWKGKPILLSPPEGLSPEVSAFFTLRHSWAWTDPNGWFKDGKDKWPWIDNHPQNPGWHTDRQKPEQISVSVAQHPISYIGRSFHSGKEPAQPTPDIGICFEEQWKRALAVDPELVFVTGWNEWIAMRFVNEGTEHVDSFLGKPIKEGGSYFVDQFDQEFSRDIEPMRGGHGDNYYYQFIANIRRYKGVRPLPKASAPKSIKIAQSFRQWSDVKPLYLDDIRDTVHRNAPMWGGKGTYVNTTGRNDFDAMKVSRDDNNLYFYVKTVEPITAPAGENWMNLYLNTDGNHKTGWEGYDFAVRRAKIEGRDVLALCKNAGGWRWEVVQEVKYVVAGKEMQFSLPRHILGLEPSRGHLRFEFKWADNVPDTGNILDFIDKGDVAPNGRFNYRLEE
ncbi:hypothetical protein LBMAG21_07960 [Armatimonadota bacterium]|nr:hypothetical protein LBMAG21_07960 [Armatimonadota bacterium]